MSLVERAERILTTEIGAAGIAAHVSRSREARHYFVHRMVWYEKETAWLVELLTLLETGERLSIGH